MKLTSLLADTRKAQAAAAGVIAQAIELGVLHGVALHWAQVASGVIAAVGVYLAPGPVQKALADVKATVAKVEEAVTPPSAPPTVP